MSDQTVPISSPPDAFDTDVPDYDPLRPEIVKLRDGARRGDDAMLLRSAAHRVSIVLVGVVGRNIDWYAIQPVAVMVGSRIDAITRLFRVLQSCYVLRPNQPMPPSSWIADS
jgi:hypothetical protein